MDTDFDPEFEGRLESVLDVLRTVGLEDETIRRLFAGGATSTPEAAIVADARHAQQTDEGDYTRRVGETTAALLRDSPLGIDLPREFTPTQLSTALSRVLEYHDCSVSLFFSDECSLARSVGPSESEFPREIELVSDEYLPVDRFHAPVESDRRRTFLAFVAFLDLYNAYHWGLKVVRLHTPDDRHTAAVLPREAYDELRGDAGAVTVDGQVVCDSVPLSEIGPPRCEFGTDEPSCWTVHMEYLVPPDEPRSTFGRAAREITAAIERFGPETSTIFYSLQDHIEIDGLRTPRELDHVYDTLESRIRLFMTVDRDYPPTYDRKHHYVAAEAIEYAPITARLDAATIEHVQWSVPDAFGHYGYTVRFQYLDGAPISDRPFGTTDHPEAFAVELQTPAGECERMVFRYPAVEAQTNRAQHPSYLFVAINRELLAQSPLEIVTLENGSGMWACTVIDTETFDGDPTTVSVGDHQLFTRIEPPFYRSTPDLELDHEAQYGISLPEETVTWPARSKVYDPPTALADGFAGTTVQIIGLAVGDRWDELEAAIEAAGGQVVDDRSGQPDVAIVSDTCRLETRRQAIADGIDLLSPEECWQILDRSSGTDR